MPGRRVFLCLLAIVATAAVGAAPAQAIQPPRGTNDVLVVLLEYRQCTSPPPACPAGANDSLVSPEQSASQWATELERTARYTEAQSFGAASWRFRILRNPQRADGWFRSPVRQEEVIASYRANGTTYASAGGGWSPGEIAARLVRQERNAGRIDAAYLRRRPTLLVIDSDAGRGAQMTDAVQFYRGRSSGDGERDELAFNGVVAASQRGFGDTTGRTGLIPHELSHTFGLADYYSNGRPDLLCPPERGGFPGVGDDNCVGGWELMGPDTNGSVTGIARIWPMSAYTRLQMGWIAPSQVRHVEASTTGRVRLDRLSRPVTTAPKVLRIADPAVAGVVGAIGTALPWLRDLLPFRGWQVECRAAAGIADAVVENGALVMFSRAGAPGRRDLWLARTSSGQVDTTAALQPGERYTNAYGGIDVRMEGWDPDGVACQIGLNARYPLITNAAALAPARSVLAGLRGRLEVTRSSGAMFSPGAVVPLAGKPLRPSTTRRRRMLAAIGSVGTAPLTGGTARLRVSRPYAVAAPCGTRPALGKAADSARFGPVAAGKRPLVELDVPGGGGSIGLHLEVDAKGDDVPDDDRAESAFAFVRVARGKAGKATVRVVAHTPRGCPGAVRWSFDALDLPNGWRLAADSRLVAPGKSKTLRAAVHTAKGTKPGTEVVPLAIVARGPGNARRTPAEDIGEVLAGGLDVAVTVGDGQAKMPPPVKVAPAAARQPGTATPQLALACGDAAAGRLSGTALPAFPGTAVAITLLGPDGVVRTKSATVGVGGAFAADTAELGPGPYAAVAALPDAGATAGVESAPCTLTIPSPGPATSSVALTCPAASGANGTAVTGSISPARAAPVTVTFRGPQDATAQATTTSAGDGSFSTSVVLPAPGTWKGTASWPGDQATTAATSAECAVQVS